MDSVFDTSRVRTQDVRSIIAGIANNHAGSQVAWRFVQMYWEKLLEQFGAGSFTMGAIIESVIGKSIHILEFKISPVDGYHQKVS